MVDNVLVDNAAAIYHFALASNNDRANKALENGYGFAIGGPGRSGDGANIGLGASIAEHLAAEGYSLALLARRFAQPVISATRMIWVSWSLFYAGHGPAISTAGSSTLMTVCGTFPIRCICLREFSSGENME